MAARSSVRQRVDDDVLRDLLVRALQDLYDADEQLVGAFAQLSRTARAKPVVRLCREGVNYTKERVRRLKRVFSLLGLPARGRRSDGMRGLIRSALRHTRQNRKQSLASDAGLIASVQQISFYGLSGYSAACLFAAKLGEKQCLAILRQSRSEKRGAVSEEAQILGNLVKRRARQSA